MPEVELEPKFLLTLSQPVINKTLALPSLQAVIGWWFGALRIKTDPVKVFTLRFFLKTVLELVGNSGLTPMLRTIKDIGTPVMDTQ